MKQLICVSQFSHPFPSLAIFTTKIVKKKFAYGFRYILNRTRKLFRKKSKNTLEQKFLEQNFFDLVKIAKNVTFTP